MAVTVGQQARIWGVAALVFLLLLWVLGNVLMPFILGAILAYLLDPVADRLVAMGIKRVWAVTTITLGAVLALVVLSLLVVPTLIEQATALVAITPQLVTQAGDWVIRTFPTIVEAESPLRGQIAELGAGLQARAGELLNTILSYGFGVLNGLLIVVVVPVVTFYLLLDWDHDHDQEAVQHPHAIA
jgi:predicted PurR-regulated permease PerM